ncbi:LPXTG cell wall anchor domain-containing protein [Nocardiopsis alborubida]|uniref:LPXTG cell wall anchor domain-containing protein n=1 Tax=Nocardiopsis alborubida TaxID=146802 RepID=A0A7X6M9I6_9ACTN|nr:LPXTG cell wall anchor domain-containing protein [Nocardiopsis alborubida]NKY96875.1 LPXTG cell wall anchor domain-containing protein [Nocardiopsis alborubida]
MSPNPGAGAFGARLFLGAALVAGTVLGGASAAFAASPASAPGDNGTVKIHDPSTSEQDNRNEPKVCDFQIVADNFDAVQEVSWEILAKAGNGGWKDVVLEGTLVLDGEGAGSTEILELDDGHYKLDWTFEGQRGNDAKHKVFKVDCGDSSEEPEPTAPEETPEEEPSTPPAEEETPDESPAPTDPVEPTAPGETEAPTAPADPSAPEGTEPEADEGNAPDGDEQSLPVTGSALTALVAAGAVAVAGGGSAVYFARRRKNADAQE